MSYQKNETEKTYPDKPPHPHDGMLPIYRKWRNQGNSTAFLPNGYTEGIDAFAQLMEPRGEREQIVISHDKIGNPHFDDPYARRLSTCLRTFLSFTDDERALIVQYIGKGVAWRGDSIEFYKSVLHETAKMRQDPDAYITESCKALQRAVRGMVV